MRETTARSWQRWRVTVAAPTPTPPALDPRSRLSLPPGTAEAAPLAPVGTEAEDPGPDGIRHELVARVRQQIADGTYDTEEKWALAEEALFRRLEGCA